jgi:hypothetical protein
LVVVGEDGSFFPSVGGEIPVFDFHLGGEGRTGIVLVSAGGKVGGIFRQSFSQMLVADEALEW